MLKHLSGKKVRKVIITHDFWSDHEWWHNILTFPNESKEEMFEVTYEKTRNSVKLTYISGGSDCKPLCIGEAIPEVNGNAGEFLYILIFFINVTIYYLTSSYMYAMHFDYTHTHTPSFTSFQDDSAPLACGFH